MKTTILCSFLALSFLSCKNEKTQNPNANINQTKETPLSDVKLADNFNESKISEEPHQKMKIPEIVNELKKGDFSTKFAKYPDQVLESIAENMTFTRTVDENGELEYIKDITDFKNNIISLYWEICGTGGCVEHQKLYIKDNKVIDLGKGYDKLSESELEELEKAIKSKIKDYSHISYRSGVDILVKGNR